jgi:hypothetical protein
MTVTCNWRRTVDGGLRRTRVIVTELEPPSHAMIIHVPDYSSVRRTLVG